MRYLKNSDAESLDVFIIKARPAPIKNESTGNMLNGKWFVQTIGTKAEKVIMQLVCSWEVVQELLGYADTKEYLTIGFLDFVKTGFIIGQPAYEIQSKRSDPRYVVDFELAVMPDV
jgi:hypothetical protein